MPQARNVAIADVSGPLSGVDVFQLINPRKSMPDPTPPGAATEDAEAAVMAGNPLTALLGVLGALVVLGWIVRTTAGLSGPLSNLFSPLFWVMNILGVMFGIVIVKLALARFPIPGLTPLVQLV